jgi:hypothetical protein
MKGKKSSKRESCEGDKDIKGIEQKKKQMI